MKIITTESGSVYEWDEDNIRFRRLGIKEDRKLKHADVVWHNAYPTSPPVVGLPIVWAYTDPETTGSLLAAGADARIRMTTLVVTVEEQDG